MRDKLKTLKNQELNWESQHFKGLILYALLYLVEYDSMTIHLQRYIPNPISNKKFESLQMKAFFSRLLFLTESIPVICCRW